MGKLSVCLRKMQEFPNMGYLLEKPLKLKPAVLGLKTRNLAGSGVNTRKRTGSGVKTRKMVGSGVKIKKMAGSGAQT